MAIVGDAYIVVRALTDKVESDIRRGFSGVEGAGRQAGESMADAFNRGFKRKSDANIFTRFSDALSTMVPEAEKARLAWAKFTRTTNTIGPIIGQLIAGIMSLIGGLGALVGSAGGAAASIAVLGNVFASFALGMMSAKLALGGVGKALGALNKAAGGGGALAANAQRIADAERNLALVIERNRESLVDANNAVRDAQLNLNEAIKQGREEIQQIGFEAENAALDEKQAAIQLAKAREALARVQDLPPNSRARQEAELAYQQAELQLRMAKDRSADLNAEQDRLARTGVAGTSAVIDATEQLSEAERNKNRVVRDGIRAQEDAERALAQAQATAASGGGGDPFEGLTESQKEFVKFLYGLKPLYQELKEVASNAFLPPLQEAIGLLADKAFPVIKNGIGAMAGAMGTVALSLAKVITNTENIADLWRLFDNSAGLLEGMGRVIGNVWDSALSILNATAPIAQKFVSFLEAKSGAFAEFLDAKQATGELEDFFNRSGEIMADFGEIFGNIFKGIGKIIEANFGPGSGGDTLLQWLKDATAKFANLDELAGGKNKLAEYFKGAAENTKAIMQSVGALLAELVKLGDNGSVKKTFDILKEGAPALGRVLQKMSDAGPALANFLVQLTEIFDKFTDTVAMEIYWNIITEALTLVNSLLENEVIRAFVDFIGRIAAVALAFGSIYRAGKFAFEAITGSLALVTGGFGKFIDVIDIGITKMGGKSGSFRSAIGGVASFLTGPWGVALAAGAVGIQLLGDYLESLQASGEEITTVLTEATSAAQIFAVAGKGRELSAWRDVELQLSDLPAVLDKAIEQTDNLFARFDSTYFGSYGALTDIGTQLSGLADANLPEAQEAFRLLADETDGTDRQMWELLDRMGPFRDKLDTQARSMGILSNATSDAERKQILLDMAMADGAFAADYEKAKIDELAGAITGYANEAAGAQNSEIRFQQTLDTSAQKIKMQQDAYIAANGSLDGFKATLDLTTQEGRDNAQMLADIATSAANASASTLENTGSQELARQKYEEGRQAIIDNAIALGYTKEEAVKLADEYLKMPTELKTTAELDDKEAKARKDALAADETSTITINAKTGNGWVDFWGSFGNFWNTGKWELAGANGMLLDYAKTSVQAFANGGMASGIYKGRPGALYKFAEPETGWEAFISGKNSQRMRNIGIWQEAGKRLGAFDAMTGPAMGGANGAPTQINAPNIAITVNPAPGMDEQSLAQAVSRQLAFEMRKGSVY